MYLIFELWKRINILELMESSVIVRYILLPYVCLLEMSYCRVDK